MNNIPNEEDDFDLEEELSEEEEVDTEGDEDDDGDDNAGSQGEEASDREVDQEEDGAEATAESSAKKEDRSARHRENRRLRKERRAEAARRNKMLISQQSKQIEALVKQLAEVQKGQGAQEIRHLESEIEQAETVYNRATLLIEEAMAENDGQKLAKALNARDNARDKYNNLVRIKQGYVENRTTHATQRDVDPTTRNLGKRWMSKHADWFQVDDEATVIAVRLSRKLEDDGYAANDAEHWQELDRRLSKYLPHYYNQGAASSAVAVKKPTASAKRPPQLVGGSGRESAAVATNGNGVDKTIPKDLVENLKAAGLWDDKKRRDRAIANYREMVKQNQQNRA